MANDITIASVAHKAGFSGPNLSIAVAVALAESGGRETAVNTKNANGSTDYGLWQINSIHTDLLKTGDWRKPEDNAKMAFKVFGSQGWNEWSAYKNGAYKMFLTRGQVAATAVIALDPFGSGGGIDTVTGAVTDSLPGVEEAKQLAKFITDKNNWKRLGFILVGALMIWFVLIAMLKQSSAVGAVTKVASTVRKVV